MLYSFYKTAYRLEFNSKVQFKSMCSVTLRKCPDIHLVFGCLKATLKC